MERERVREREMGRGRERERGKERERGRKREKYLRFHKLFFKFFKRLFLIILHVGGGDFVVEIAKVKSRF